MAKNQTLKDSLIEMGATCFAVAVSAWILVNYLWPIQQTATGAIAALNLWVSFLFLIGLIANAVVFVLSSAFAIGRIRGD